MPIGDYDAKVGGKVAPDGKTEIQIDLPGSQQSKNIGSPPPNGPGCCVFRSIDHAARWQNLPALQQFPEWMVSKHIAGGGWPAKVSELIPEIAADRKLPVPDYVQVQGSDLTILKLATATGRMPAVTYGISPTGRYGGSRIAHMVNCVHATDTYFAVLDNNYIGESNYEWMSPTEFSQSYTINGGGWAVILLDVGPPPAPRN